MGLLLGTLRSNMQTLSDVVSGRRDSAQLARIWSWLRRHPRLALMMASMVVYYLNKLWNKRRTAYLAGQLHARNIVVFVDGTPQADRAFEEAVRWKKPNDNLTVNYVVPIKRSISGRVLSTLTDADSTAAPPEDIIEKDQLKKDAERLVQSYKDHCNALQVGNVVCDLSYSHNPERAAMDLLKRSKASVVFVGTRGVKGLERLVLGSFSQSVVENSPCSVFLVKS